MLLAGLLGWGAAQTAPATPPAVPARVALSTWAERHHLKSEPAAEPQSLLLAGAGRQLELTPGLREIRIDGLRAFLCWPVGGSAPQPERLTLAAIDAERLLDPLFQPAVEPQVREPRTVILDPGHGGKDEGARGPAEGLVEKRLTLDLALRLKKLLETSGYRVLLTRSDDSFLELPLRPSFANVHAGDLFISLHFNFVSNKPDVRGIETYVLTPRYAASTSDTAPEAGAPADPRARELFEGNQCDKANSLLGFLVHGQLIRSLKVPDRGYKRARFAVLRDLAMPGVLIEGGFVTNTEDARLLLEPAWRDRLAASIAAGIADYHRAIRLAHGKEAPLPGIVGPVPPAAATATGERR